MREIILGLFIIILLVLGGCSSVKGVAGKLGECMTKCNEICSLIKQNNLDLEDFNQLGVKRQTGGSSLYCECVCENDLP